MDRFFGPTSAETVAYNYITDNGSHWDIESSINETHLAGCVAYQALDRYLKGADLFILPRSRTELESIFRRYTYDAVHNMIAKSRSTLQPGGYSRVCHLAEKSLRDVLNSGDNCTRLLALHTPPSSPIHSSAARGIKTQ
ncbi:hypothetical protein BDZ89DRAFT_975670 [Hymenopellis radicata]|nr:hypothetical protein BDZ89DRAFT_975670 [Hymenopellis radicata]